MTELSLGSAAPLEREPPVALSIVALRHWQSGSGRS